MNDELNGQLCDRWQIPSYAQGNLYVATPTESVRVEGEQGFFTLSSPSPFVTVRWGAPDGVGLMQLRWRADSLGWAGSVRVGGMIDAIHLMGADTEQPLGIVYFSGQVLLPNTTPHPMTPQRLPMKPNFWSGIDANELITVTTWVLDYDSPLFTIAQDAMSNKLNCFFFGRLYDDEEMGNRRSPMPFGLDEVTLFMT